MKKKTAMTKLLSTLGIIAAILIVLMALGPFYIVNEGTQSVITRFGEIVITRTEAGLYFKVPFIDIVTTYPKLILSLDGDSQRIPTKENQFIIVDTTSRWKIIDPKLFYQSCKTLDVAYIRISDVIDSATRTIITKNSLSEVVRTSNIINDKPIVSVLSDANIDTTMQIESLTTEATISETVSKGRRELSIEMANSARQMLLSEYGIQLIDIVPRQIKYSDEMTESVYNRMIKDRNQIAQYYRSLGEGKKAEWLGKLENEKRSLMSESYKASEEIKGEADAKASSIYAAAYSKDPEFYAFWKSLESYKTTMTNFEGTFSTNMDYFNYLYAPDGKR